jgi:hypothetical protein
MRSDSDRKNGPLKGIRGRRAALQADLREQPAVVPKIQSREFGEGEDELPDEARPAGAARSYTVRTRGVVLAGETGRREMALQERGLKCSCFQAGWVSERRNLLQGTCALIRAPGTSCAGDLGAGVQKRQSAAGNASVSVLSLVLAAPPFLQHFRRTNRRSPS